MRLACDILKAGCLLLGYLSDVIFETEIQFCSEVKTFFSRGRSEECKKGVKKSLKN
jgi:hypothetical protein